MAASHPATSLGVGTRTTSVPVSCTALFRAVDNENMELAAKAILDKAKRGNVVAFRELADRLIGKAVAMDILDRLNAIEAEVFGE